MSSVPESTKYNGPRLFSFFAPIETTDNQICKKEHEEPVPPQSARTPVYNETQYLSEQIPGHLAARRPVESSPCIQALLTVPAAVPLSAPVTSLEHTRCPCVICSVPYNDNIPTAHGSPTSNQGSKFPLISFNGNPGAPPSASYDVSGDDHNGGGQFLLVPDYYLPAYEAHITTDELQREWLEKQAMLEQEAMARCREQQRVAWIVNSGRIAHHRANQQAAWARLQHIRYAMRETDARIHRAQAEYASKVSVPAQAGVRVRSGEGMVEGLGRAPGLLTIQNMAAEMHKLRTEEAYWQFQFDAAARTANDMQSYQMNCNHHYQEILNWHTAQAHAATQEMGN